MTMAFACPAWAEDSTQSKLTLTTSQLFGFADSRRDAGDYAAAETAYRALTENINSELRNEARFRLGMMLADKLQRYREAAIEFRRILDEQPGAPRVRLELARMQTLLGNMSAARREIRAAQAGGLPPEVERMVRFYAAALQAQKRMGGSIEVALAPDSNINRATRSETLGTVIGNFTLDQNAQARSGLGLTLRGQGYWRPRIDATTNMLVRLNTSGNLYRDSQFNDLNLGIQAGPEYTLGANRLTLAAGPTWRWYGMTPYSRSLSASASFIHPLGPRAQLRLDGEIGHTAYQLNASQTAHTFALAAGYDRALTPRSGAGLQVNVRRTAARDPGWSDVTAGLSAYAFREIGRTSAVFTLGYARLEGDARLKLFPDRRVDNRFSASASATWRALQWKGLAPITRIRWERNQSKLDLYHYHRIAAEIGITSAF